MTVLWIVLAFLLGGSAGAFLMAVVTSGRSSDDEWEAYRRGYQLGLTEPRR